MTLIVVIAALVAGMGARWVASSAEGSTLADLLPWSRPTPVTLFFLDASGEHLVPVSRSLQRDEASPSALIEALLAGPAGGSGLIPSVPTGTRALSITLEEGHLTVDLSREFISASTLGHTAVHQSLSSWPEAASVAIEVEGDAMATGQADETLLFFYNEERDMLIASLVKDREPRDVLAAYLDGPTESGLVGLPLDVSLLSFSFSHENGLLALDFTYRDSVREFATDHPDAMRRVLEGLIATMVSFPEVDAVRIDFEGHNTLGLGQCADLLRTPQVLPDVLNDERLLSLRAES